MCRIIMPLVKMWKFHWYSASIKNFYFDYKPTLYMTVTHAYGQVSIKQRNSIPSHSFESLSFWNAHINSTQHKYPPQYRRKTHTHTSGSGWFINIINIPRSFLYVVICTWNILYIMMGLMGIWKTKKSTCCCMHKYI